MINKSIVSAPKDEQEAQVQAELHRLDFQASAQLATVTKHQPPVVLPPNPKEKK